MYNNQFHLGNYNLDPQKRDRLRVIMTTEERGFYSGLFQIADKDNKGKLVGKEAADFLKKSSLSKDVLKTIWLIAAQTDPQFLERDEFYIALRLIALAQNNMDYSEESIRLNHPSPPLPKFDLKNSSNFNSSNNFDRDQSQDTNINSSNMSGINQSIKETDPWEINDEDSKKYSILFNKNKDLENKMSISKAYQMWQIAGVSNDLMKKILAIVPLVDKMCLNFNEFKVIFHLIYKSLEIEIPDILPVIFRKYLGIGLTQKEIYFGENLGSNQKKISNSNNLLTSNSTNLYSPNFPDVTLMNNKMSNVDLEANLLNEFNLKQENLLPVKATNINSSTINTPINALNTSNSSTIVNNNGNNTISPIKLINSPGNNNLNNNSNVCAVNPFSTVTTSNSNIQAQTVNSPNYKAFSQNINENFSNNYKEAVKENQFLSKVLDEDNTMLSNILEDIEKIARSINMVNEKNKILKEQIVDIRKRINIEKENLSKSVVSLNQKTIELVNNQEELVKEMHNMNNLHNMRYAGLNATNNINNDVEQMKFNSYSMNTHTGYNVEVNNVNSNTENFNTNFNLSIPQSISQTIPQNKITQNTITQNIIPQNTIPQNTISQIAISQNINSQNIIPQNTIQQNAISQNTISQNTIPQNTTQSNHLNYPNLTDSLNFNFPQNFQQPYESKNEIKNNTGADFDFDGFNNDIKIDSFKEFAEKKGDDIFKSHSDFNSGWDDF